MNERRNPLLGRGFRPGLRRRVAWSLVLVATACHRGAPQGATPPGGLSVARDEIEIALVESPPLETTLDHPDVANAADVWVAMIDGARRTLDFAEFYASEAEPKDVAGSKLAPVLAALERAVKRNVRVRFLADKVFAPKYPETLDRLRAAGVVVRIIDFGTRAGGVLHAKYFVVDGSEAFIGSQNFDWRALSHIQEMGVRVRSRAIAVSLLDLLDTDWELAGGALDDKRVRAQPFAMRERVVARTGESLSLVASPKGWLPDEGAWDLPRLAQLIGNAKIDVDVQVLVYKTTDRDGNRFPTLDDALRGAATRGVRVRLLVSDWSTKPGSEARKALEALSQVPKIEVRVITIPPWSGGEIPFARVAHAKYMVVDAGTPGSHAWVGTSNWEGDYFTKSRNVGIIADGGALPARLGRVFEDGWRSTYTTPLASLASAPPPSPAPASPAATAPRPSSSGPARP